MFQKRYFLYNFSIFFVLFFALDDHSVSFFLVLPWLFYLIFFTFNHRSNINVLIIGIIAVLFFFGIQAYNKNESSLYHEAIIETIVLPHDIYISSGFRSDKFNTSIYQNESDKEKSYRLKKGTEVKIIAFLPKSGFESIYGLMFGNPMYDIAIETGSDAKIKSIVDSENTKFYRSHPIVWSNNFFDSLGTLNSGIVKDYSFTDNFFFRIVYLLYPFMLLYMLIEVFSKKIYEIETKYRFNPLNLILYPTAYYYILMAALNDGFSSFLLGIPYALFLLREINLPKNSKSIKFVHMLILICALVFIIFDRSTYQLIYPSVGKNYTVVKDVNYTYGNYYINTIEIDPIAYEKEDKKRYFQLNSGDVFKIKSQIVTGHADFGINYTYEIESKSFDLLREYISANMDHVKTKLYNTSSDNSFAGKEKLYLFEKDKFYIKKYDLKRLLKIQNLKDIIVLNRFDTGIIYMSFYLFIYPVIFILFLLILKARDKKLKKVDS